MMTLTEDQIDALNEVINIGIGTAINSLNDLVNSFIKLSIPKIELIHRDALPPHLGLDNYSVILQSFEGSFNGVASLIFDQETAKKLVATIIDIPIDSALLETSINETLSEVGNIIINALIGHISNILHANLHFKLPFYTTGTIQELSKYFYIDDNDNVLLIATTKFEIESIQIDGFILLSFPSKSLEKLLSLIFKVFNDDE
ncbi:MAG: chemotaxis protein CheX [Candidatus Cloacimonetes bacterium]|nr:chemotaxis protein CheX [Candidatus Cloacimonadota bacterium]